MTRAHDSVAAYVDAVLGGRRPRRFRASASELDAVRAASALAVARTDRSVPDPGYLDRLHARLARELDPPSATRPVSRRTLLGAGAAAVFAGVLGGGLGAVLARPAAPAGGLLHVDGATWLDAANAADLAPGTAAVFSTAAMNILVVNLGGRLRAFSGTCTHLGCRLQPAAGAIACPCHRTTFALDGRVLTHELPAAPAPLPELPARVVGGRVEVLAI